MSEYRDRLVDEVVDQVVQRQSTPDDPDLVREETEVAVDELVDEPVQTFTPLLAENKVVTELVGRDQGTDEEPQQSEPA